MTYHSHITFIQRNATRFPRKLALKLPQFEVDDGTPHQKIIGWRHITYATFYRDIILSAEYWSRILQGPHMYGSVIGLWTSGMVYQDFVHLFGLIMARFVPQILNLSVRSVEAAMGYFKLSNIVHIIYAPTAPIEQLKDSFQVHELIDVEQLPLPTDEILDLTISSPLKQEKGDDTIMIYHTSGSTSGKPKLVPYTREWIDGQSRKPLPGLLDGKEVGIAINGIVHISQLSNCLQEFKNGGCIVLMPWIDFTGAELIQIITECKANALHQLSPIFGKILREAMTNAELRMVLKSLSFVSYGGADFGANERLWAIENGISIIVRIHLSAVVAYMELRVFIQNVYGSTETGITMFSRDDPIILHPLKHPGLVYKFINPDAEKTDIETKTEDPKNTLVELVISSSSLDCPHPSLCDLDGHFHTKDLFEEIEPNGFIYRGRLDDIIMMDEGQKCDTLFLESQVLLSCKDLISVCVVVGSGKPSPVLLVEPLEETVDIGSLKENIGKKVELVNKDGPSYERIRPSDILIVPPGTLPRTPKGNINRNAAERLFRQDIDAFFDI